MSAPSSSLAGAARASDPAAFVSASLRRARLVDDDTSEMFGSLYARMLAQATQPADLSSLRPPGASLLASAASLPPLPAGAPPSLPAALLAKVAVVKLNGGLGSAMGCLGAKSSIVVRDGATFLDLTVRQVEFLNLSHGADVPLLLLNSFHTHDDTLRLLARYSEHHVAVTCFTQACLPRLCADSLTPLPLRALEPGGGSEDAWTTGGHGEVYRALEKSGVLDALLAQGREYVFISNVDNLGATVDLAILQHVVASGVDFAMEVVARTRADVQGGVLVEGGGGRARLLELSQVPRAQQARFSLRAFSAFNTNSLWVALRPCKALLAAGALKPPVLVSERTLRGGARALELETAAGAAIEFFERAAGILVPRSRFLPVKSTADLLAIQSKLYALAHGSLLPSPARELPSPPVIKLGAEFAALRDYLARIPYAPNLDECEHLTVSGDVHFGEGVVVKGTVVIVASAGSRLDIPAGAVLDDAIVTGSLRILAH